MREQQIIEEIKRYLTDTTYNYAVMIDGDWGCGKTYFVKHGLTDAIKDFVIDEIQFQSLKYVSLYGCKTISDIKDAIVFSLGADLVKPDKSSKPSVGRKALFSAWQIAKAYKDNATPNTSLFDLLENWQDLSSFVFAFDDLERCDCPLNEVFGFINGLVEHDGIKVILIANENEIQMKEVVEQKELQYLITMNNQIDFPQEKDAWERKINNKLISIDELERRRGVLFPQRAIGDEFRRVREKLIGVIYRFEPDIEIIFENIIERASFSEDIKKSLIQNTKQFVREMSEVNHLNIRTFQFFISKLNKVFSFLKGFDIDERYYEFIKDRIILDCFEWAVDFKANTPLPESKIERIAAEMKRQSRFQTLKQYIEFGELEKEPFEAEIRNYMEGELALFIPEDDPFKRLEKEYYLHSQEWCENRIKDILGILERDDYPTTIYGGIIRILCILEDIGFDNNYLDNAKRMMITNISNYDNPKVVFKQFFYSTEGNQEILNRARQVMVDLDEAVERHNNASRRNSLQEILKQDCWVQHLISYTETPAFINDPNKHVFFCADSEIWADHLMNTTSADIYNFRLWFKTLYPKNYVNQDKILDYAVIEKVLEGLDIKIVSDLVVKKQLEWLMEEMKEVCSVYRHHLSLNTSTESEKR